MYLAVSQLEVRYAGQAQAAVHNASFGLRAGQIGVLIGPSGCGKTTLLRAVAGLEPVSAGSIHLNKQLVGAPQHSVAPEERRIGMVFQDYALFPHLSIGRNVAFGIHQLPRAEQAARVFEVLQLVGLEGSEARFPHELSGGQQQRVALARALAKGAPLMLLDEPLVNLDYKLREELREELTQLFAAGQSTVVYATTEPGEALLLGGYTAVMHEGRLLQYGPTAEVFHAPNSLSVARAFSDPPMNLMTATRQDGGVRLSDGTVLPLPLPPTASASLTVGVRASALRVQSRPGDVEVQGVVELAEISGSDTFVHVDTPWGELVAQLTGVHYFELGAQVRLHLNPAQAYVFGADEALVLAPQRAGGR